VNCVTDVGDTVLSKDESPALNLNAACSEEAALWCRSIRQMQTEEWIQNEMLQ